MWLSDCVARLTSGLSIVVIQLTHVTVGDCGEGTLMCQC